MSKAKNEEFATTYSIGNTIIHIVAPPPMTEEEVEKVLAEYHSVGWSIIDELNEKQTDNPY
jgi:hypothetical protein